MWLRALFARRLCRSASTRADAGFFLLNNIGGSVTGAILAGSLVDSWTQRGLIHALGASPATALPHHQVHHSGNPAHFGRNFGPSLAVWDRLAGTLYVPGTRRERLTFGTGATIARPQSMTGILIAPFIEAAQTVYPNGARGSGRALLDLGCPTN